MPLSRSLRQIVECWREGQATLIKLSSKPDVSSWVGRCGSGAAAGARPGGTARQPPAAVQPTGPPVCAPTWGVQMPDALASKFPDLEYQDVVRYDPHLLAQPPYELHVHSVAPFLGDKVRPPWCERRAPLLLSRVLHAAGLRVHGLHGCWGCAWVRRRRRTALCCARRGASPAASGLSRWGRTGAATRWSRRSSSRACSALGPWPRCARAACMRECSACWPPGVRESLAPLAAHASAPCLSRPRPAPQKLAKKSLQDSFDEMPEIMERRGGGGDRGCIGAGQREW